MFKEFYSRFELKTILNVNTANICQTVTVKYSFHAKRI